MGKTPLTDKIREVVFDVLPYTSVKTSSQINIYVYIQETMLLLLYYLVILEIGIINK